jgi:hypothetical protein
VVLLSLLSAYVTLPWWAPTDLIRRRLCQDLSRQVGAEVQIGELKLSWSDGIEINSLVIRSPAPFDPGPMVLVEQVRMDFSPLDMLAHRRIAWMEIDRPRVWGQIDANGNVNLTALARIQTGVDPDRIGVRQGRVSLRLPGQDRLLHFNVSDAQLVAGRVQRLGRVTVSADLEQRDTRAPVGLNVSADEGAGVSVAATFNFSNIDLQQLPLLRLLDLPLRKLAGRCGGSLKLRMNRSGVAEQFDLNVVIRQLDAQPIAGPAMPVVEEAGLSVRAAIDFLGEQTQLHAWTVRLPGAELSGSGVMSHRAGLGNWEGIKSLDVSGTIDPARLGALLTRGGRLPGDLEFDGPVRIDKLHLRHADARVDLVLDADARAAGIRCGKRLLKPAGRRCSVHLAGTMNDQTWTAEVQKETQLTLGENTLYLQAKVPNIRQSLERWSSRAPPMGLRDILGELCQVEGRGAWEIRELDSIRDLHPELASALATVRLRGAVQGTWSLDRRTRSRFDAQVDLPPSAGLEVPGRFTQPDDEPARLVLAGTIEPNELDVRDLAVEFDAGPTRVHVGGGHVHYEPAGPGAGAAVTARGELSAADVETLHRWFPDLNGLQDKLRGSVTAEFSGRIGREVQQVSLTASAKDLDVSWDRDWRKPSGQDATVQIDFTRDTMAPPDSRNRCDLQWRSDPARIVAHLAGPDGETPGSVPRTGRLESHLTIADARWLKESFPAIRTGLRDVPLVGRLDANVSLRWRPRRVEGSVTFNAGGLQFAATEPVRVNKRTGVTFTGSVAGLVERREPNEWVVSVSEGSVELAGSRANLSGQAVVGEAVARIAARPGSPGFLSRLREFQGRLDATICAEESLADFLPDLGDVIRRHGLAGPVPAWAEAVFDGNDFLVKAHLDGENLAVASFLPKPVTIAELPTWVPGACDANGRPGQVEIGPIRKPVGIPARADLEITAQGDLSRFSVHNLRGSIGGVELLAGGVLTGRPVERGLPSDWTVQSGHLSVSARKIEDLVRLCPQLAPFKPAGDFFTDLEWTNQDGGRLPYVTIRTDNLRGRYRDKDLLLSGELTLRDLRPKPSTPGAAGPDRETEKLEFQIGGIKTEDLEFAVGKNHGWITAEIAHVATEPNGTFRLVMAHLDNKDLAEWLSSSRTKDLKEVGKDAQSAIVQARQWLARANLTGRGSIDHLRTFDESVRQTYDLREVELAATVRGGLIQTLFGASVNGGTYTTRSEINLNAAEPALTSQSEIREVIATPNIQPQVSRFFPGNTVNGTFTRSEDMTTPLRDVLANVLDARWPCHPRGTATTVAVEGTVVGRAAPKFVTTFFPGLNLTTFQYNRMTGLAKFLPDGTAENQMIFSGPVYDVYMEGKTSPDNMGEYQIGLVILGTTVPASVHFVAQQGRIPILKFRGRIVDGKIHDEEVSYFWPHETAFEIFLKKNFIWIWLTAPKK